MQVAHSADFSGSAWEAYRSSKSWPLAEGSGRRRVYVRVVYDGGDTSTVAMAEVTVSSRPVAAAGSDVVLALGESVRLDGGGSIDADGDRLSYRWEAPSGLRLSGALTAEPTLTADRAGVYWVTLVVNDGAWDSAPDEVRVTVLLLPPLTAELPGGTEMDFVWIEAGTFTMGSPSSESRFLDERPQHEVTISRGYYLGKYEITQGQWEVVMGTTPWSRQSSVRSNVDHPAVYISWNDVQVFVQKLNAVAGDSLYRLPSEAEWEYAARAGTSTRWSFGENKSWLGNYAWYGANVWNVDLRSAQPVGTKRPNPWGLHDMHGNVWEWVQDWYGGYSSSPSMDPPGPVAGSDRVVRGGGFWFGGVTLGVRSASRFRSSPFYRGRSPYIGVRLLRVR